MKPRTFAEIYCEQEGLKPAEWPAVLLQRTLYPHARLLAGVVRWLDHRHFLADYEFVEDVGHLRSLEEFTPAMDSYVEHPDNRGLLRRKLRIRVSARRMLGAVRTVFAAGGHMVSPKGNTFEPFGGG